MAAQQSPSLAERLAKIKSPKLQNQKETAVVLSAIEDTLKSQGHDDYTPTAYFAALLALLSQATSQAAGVVNKELATSVVYLLDIVASYVSTALLRSKFTQILASIAPALTQQDVEAPLLRHSMGCLETLLIAQDSQSWNLPQTQVGPRGAVAGILALALEHRPKVRKRAQEALTIVLKNPPPSPSLDHPAADMCAETTLRSLHEVSQTTQRKHKGRDQPDKEHYSSLIHALQLVKTIAAVSGGWPSKRIDPLCETLLSLSKSNNEYLAMVSFEVFETILTGMANDSSSVKLARLLKAIADLRPSQNDSQLLPQWIAVISRGYDVSGQVDPDETFLKLPEVFEMISTFLASSSHNIRISASECLISFTATCIPSNVILEPSMYDEKTLDRIAKIATNLLSVKYQGAWMEVFNVLSALFQTLKWQSTPRMNEAIKLMGDLRENESFNGKKEADLVLGAAVGAAGPEAVLEILPLNLSKPKAGERGRAWLLPLLRDNVVNATLKHFSAELVPLSETLFQKVLDHGEKEKTMEVKIFETLVQQIWSILTGYCTLCRDVIESFNQEFAELISNLLYSQTNLRADICKALQTLVQTNKDIASLDAGEEDILLQHRISKATAQKNLEHLSSFAANLLAVLFNVYSQTLPHHRGYILQCINVYLSITPENELEKTFENVTTHLEAALKEQTAQTQADKQKQKQSADKMPPTSHTLMDLLITLSIYLPRSSYQKLFSVAALLLPQSSDPQLQKKAYKLLPRLATSPTGSLALKERNTELQELLLTCASSVSASARRDRLAAIAVVIEHMPSSTLHFIPSVLSEVVMAAKEVNEKARTAAFDLLVQMGKKIAEGGTIIQSKIPHMPNDAPNATASLEEYFTMVSAGLAGNTPHMISASVTALTRILYEFRTELSERVLEDLVGTMDLFLTSKNREIVRSVLGFSKVAIISLPDSIVLPRLPTMIPSLLGWSHEHKNQFRVRVKHIIERAIRRFGYERIERYCPEEDKKLVHNIHKTKERKKRKKAGAVEEAGADGEGEQTEKKNQRKGKFESEFDAAVYGSDDSANDDEGGSDFSISDASSNEHGAAASKGRKSQKQKERKSYIIEPSGDGDPLDLLDRRAFASISSSKPVRFKEPARGKKRAAKTDADGKLVFREEDANDDNDMMDVDGAGKEPGDGTLEGGINAYVAAIRGRDAVKRGRGGRLKYSNRREKGGEMEGDEEDGEGMDVDAPAKQNGQDRNRDRGRGREGGRGRGMANGDRGRNRNRGGKSFKDDRRERSGKGMQSAPARNEPRKEGGVRGGRFRVAKHRARAGGAVRGRGGRR